MQDGDVRIDDYAIVSIHDLKHLGKCNHFLYCFLLLTERLPVLNTSLHLIPSSLHHEDHFLLK